MKIENKNSSIESEAYGPNEFELKYLKKENYESPPRELLKLDNE
jgi:hypothetical protein